MRLCLHLRASGSPSLFKRLLSPALHVIWVLRFADLGLLGTQNGNFSRKWFAWFFPMRSEEPHNSFRQKGMQNLFALFAFLHFCSASEIEASSELKKGENKHNIADLACGAIR